jgi:cellobiose transport system substrate-binding protein
MNLSLRRGRGTAVGALFIGLAVLATSCADSDSEGSSDSGKIKLVINDFGNFGYKDLIKEYQQSHPNIEIAERTSEFNAHHQRLSQSLAAGTGAGDIEAVDEGFIVQFRAQPQNFNNLLDLGADKLKDRWLDWKWQQSLSGDGKTQIGLGTDVGGLAMCYRKDLFAKAGLPTDRDQVSALWRTWDAFIETGRRFEAAKTGAHWVDAATNMFNPILAQQPQGYYDESDKLIMDTNAGVRQAWDTTVRMIEAGQSAKLTAFTNQWTSGMQKGTFATIACPAWMLGYIKENAPKTQGMWDIAAVPGGGGGNWGGSFLTIPKQSKHPKEAYELAAWLTAPEQELRIFKETGNLPSEPELYKDPAVAAYKNPFFNNAPVGEIFTSSAESLKPQYLGSKNGPVRQAVENALRQVESGRLKADAGWDRALKDAKRAAGQ